VCLDFGLSFSEKVFNCGKISNKTAKIGQNGKNTFFSTCYLRNQKIIEISANIARGVPMMPELFVFKLCTALIFSCNQNFSLKAANTQNANFFRSHGGATYTHKQRIHRATMRVDYSHAAEY